MNTAARTTQINLRISPSLKARADKAAARDHRSLTSLIEKLLADYLRGRVGLDDWHRKAQERFERLAIERGQGAALATRKYRAFSFAIHTADGFELPPQNLRDIVAAIPSVIRGAMNPRLFHVFTRLELAPHFVADYSGHRAADSSNPEGDPGEILESAIFPDISKFGSVDFWRITPAGFATHIEPYREDELDSAGSLKAGQWFWPFKMIQDLYELVLFAQLLAGRFDNVDTIEFRCEWWGLQGREIADTYPAIHWLPNKVAHQDHRVTAGEWDLEQLKCQADIVSALAAPIMRLFDPAFDCSADWVAQQTKRFKGGWG